MGWRRDRRGLCCRGRLGRQSDHWDRASRGFLLGVRHRMLFREVDIIVNVRVVCVVVEVMNIMVLVLEMRVASVFMRVVVRVVVLVIMDHMLMLVASGRKFTNVVAIVRQFRNAARVSNLYALGITASSGHRRRRRMDCLRLCGGLDSGHRKHWR